MYHSGTMAAFTGNNAGTLQQLRSATSYRAASVAAPPADTCALDGELSAADAPPLNDSHAPADASFALFEKLVCRKRSLKKPELRRTKRNERPVGVPAALGIGVIEVQMVKGARRLGCRGG
jgi:hypothetical protein